MSAPSPRARRSRRSRGTGRWDRPGSGPPGAVHLLQVLRGLDPFVLLALGTGRGRSDLSVHELVPDPRGGAAALFGIRAPAGTTVVGASFLGVERSTEDGSRGAEVRIDVAVGRDGSVRSSVRAAGDEPPATRPGKDGPTDGRVIDALHRVLGIASPGAPPPVEGLVTGLWMLQIVPVLGDGTDDGAPSWAEVAALHPEAPERAGPVGSVPPSPEALADATAALCAGESWERLRRSAAAGRFDAPELDAEEAAWMDTTLFARWMVESFPPSDRVVAELRRLGGDAAADGIESVLRLLPPAAEVA